MSKRKKKQISRSLHYGYNEIDESVWKNNCRAWISFTPRFIYAAAKINFENISSLNNVIKHYHLFIRVGTEMIMPWNSVVNNIYTSTQDPRLLKLHNLIIITARHYWSKWFCSASFPQNNIWDDAALRCKYQVLIISYWETSLNWSQVGCTNIN